MPLLDAIITRRTARSYKSEPVPFALFNEIVNLSMHAPTACNEQRWKIIYIDDANLLHELYERGSSTAINNTQQALLILYNNYTDNIEYRDDIQSAAAFLNTFSLVAHSVGIGSCWVNHLPNKRELKTLLNIHKRYDPAALMTFGYYRTRVKMVPRKKEATQMIAKNKFNFDNLNFDKNKNVFARTIFRWVYYRIPVVLRKKLRKRSLKYEKKFYYEVYD
ncbi:nitroreductase family protein [Alphaproteobacteria bacterium]|nr:nitroreductase family protein [Alphaproteobacteria bacterium]